MHELCLLSEARICISSWQLSSENGGNVHFGINMKMRKNSSVGKNLMKAAPVSTCISLRRAMELFSWLIRTIFHDNSGWIYPLFSVDIIFILQYSFCEDTYSNFFFSSISLWCYPMPVELCILCMRKILHDQLIVMTHAVWNGATELLSLSEFTFQIVSSSRSRHQCGCGLRLVDMPPMPSEQLQANTRYINC